jgi:HPt (histidine-containing phosphotransfer) domain-containing protein
MKPSAESLIVPSTDMPLDLARFNDLTAGDREFANDLATTFAASGHQQLAEIGKALESFDRGAVARAAHQLKGASANIYAQPLAELAARLESEAPDADLGQLQQVSEALRHEFNRVNDFLADSLPDTGAAARLRLPPGRLPPRS